MNKIKLYFMIALTFFTTHPNRVEYEISRLKDKYG